MRYTFRFLLIPADQSDTVCVPHSQKLFYTIEKKNR